FSAENVTTRRDERATEGARPQTEADDLAGRATRTDGFRERTGVPGEQPMMIDSPNAMSQVGAFFDVDRTIVSCNTGRLFLRDLRQRGEISFFRALRALFWMAKYHLSLIDLQWVAARLAGEMAGKLEREFAETCRLWVERDVLPLVVP